MSTLTFCRHQSWTHRKFALSIITFNRFFAYLKQKYSCVRTQCMCMRIVVVHNIISQFFRCFSPLLMLLLLVLLYILLLLLVYCFCNYLTRRRRRRRRRWRRQKRSKRRKKATEKKKRNSMTCTRYIYIHSLSVCVSEHIQSYLLDTNLHTDTITQV